MPVIGGENFSPLKYFYQLLPSSDDKALKQAFYNTLAFAFVGVFSVACIAVYFILEAFIRPLIWALLVGSCLHPIKRKLTSVLKIWIGTTQKSSRPLFVEAAILPLTAVLSLLDAVYIKIMRYRKIVLSAVIVVPCLFGLLSLVPIKTHFEVLTTIWMQLSRLIRIFSTTWILLGIVLYLSLVTFYWTPESSAMLKLLSLPVWVGIVFYLSSITGIFGVPLFVSFVSLVCLGCIFEIRDSLLSDASFVDSTLAFFRRCRVSPSPTPAVDADADADADVSSDAGGGGGVATADESAVASDADADEEAAAGAAADSPDGVGGGGGVLLANSSAIPPTTPRSATLRRASSVGGGARRQSASSAPRLGPGRLRRSKYVFVLLLWAHAIAYAWARPWTLSLLPFVAAFVALRSLGDSIGGSETVKGWARAAYTRLAQLAHERRDALAPFPVRGICKLLLRGDRKLTDILSNSIDAIVSIFVIFLVLSASVFLAIFLTIQVQRESIELVTMTSRVLNNTVITASNSLLPETANLQKLLDSMMGNAYIFGREWISRKINSMFDTNDYNKAKIEEQVLQLWDRLYEKLAAKNFTWSPLWSGGPGGGGSASDANRTAESPSPSRQPRFERQLSGLFSSSAWELVSAMLDTNKVMDFVKENLGILTSVLESLWIVVKGNFSLLVTLFTTVLSILFGGGTAVLNFLLQSLVFLTSLYLLLCFSGELYLPVQFISTMSSSSTKPHPVVSALYSAVDDATSGVFLASMQMSCFYGLYTSLTHTVFAVNLVFSPSVLAAVFGAVPFLGTYWASLPGALELWLIHDQPALAALFVLLHLLPAYFVDPIIYSEIKGAGHPYLTGLSVAGGLYWCGLEGAIFGPILLACLLVAVNVYSIVLSPTTDSSKASRSTEATSVRRSQSMFNHKDI